jgi:hypothetical protein
MKKRSRELEIFSLSFLDVISCGFGAVILLVLISSFNRPTEPEPQPVDPTASEVAVKQVLSAEERVATLKRQVAAAEAEATAKSAQLERMRAQAGQARAGAERAGTEADRLKSNAEGLALAQSALQRAAIQPNTAVKRIDQVGGIPIDSEYVVFIIDTSGSMQMIWSKVVREVENVLKIHPELKGFQILSDDGAHLLSAYEGRWIPDTPGRRQSVLNLFRTWKAGSNSSPVEGLEEALKRYAKPGQSLSIYIFGDDYTGSSYDPVIATLNRLNTNRVSGAKLAKVHAIGFLSNYTTNRYSILMREVVRQNGGTFLGLPR